MAGQFRWYMLPKGEFPAEVYQRGYETWVHNAKIMDEMNAVERQANTPVKVQRDFFCTQPARFHAFTCFVCQQPRRVLADYYHWDDLGHIRCNLAQAGEADGVGMAYADQYQELENACIPPYAMPYYAEANSGHIFDGEEMLNAVREDDTTYTIRGWFTGLFLSSVVRASDGQPVCSTCLRDETKFRCAWMH
jgi:hypothetical protein